MAIICQKFTPVNKGYLIGYVDLFLEKQGIEIRSCQYMQKEGKKWLSMPSKEFQTPEGEKKYYNLIRFVDKEVDRQFQQSAIASIEAYIQQHGAAAVPKQTVSNEVPF